MDFGNTNPSKKLTVPNISGLIDNLIHQTFQSRLCRWSTKWIISHGIRTWKKSERENRWKHTHNYHLILPTLTRKPYVVESINKLTRCKTYNIIVNLFQKSLLQKVIGAKLFAVTNNTNAEILQFAEWSKFKQLGQDFFIVSLPMIAWTLPCSSCECERRHETTATMSDDICWQIIIGIRPYNAIMYTCTS